VYEAKGIFFNYKLSESTAVTLSATQRNEN